MVQGGSVRILWRSSSYGIGRLNYYMFYYAICSFSFQVPNPFVEQFRSVPKISDRQGTEDVDNRFRKGLADKVLPCPDLLLGAFCLGFRFKGKAGNKVKVGSSF